MSNALPATPRFDGRSLPVVLGLELDSKTFGKLPLHQYNTAPETCPQSKGGSGEKKTRRTDHLHPSVTSSNVLERL